MVNGIDTFRKWFEGNEEQYVIIGGTACDLLMRAEGFEFRATKDIDLVFMVEATNSEFGKKFWRFVKTGGYTHYHKSTGIVQFYRFTHPKSKDFPAMIELFARRSDIIPLSGDAAITPLPFDDDTSSLSAILLDDDYYEFLKQGKLIVDGISILDPAHLIPFKAKAWLDLTKRKRNGEHIDTKNIKKHKNDVFRLTELINPFEKIPAPKKVYTDIQEFIACMKTENVSIKQLGIVGRSKEMILKELKHLYSKNS